MRRQLPCSSCAKAGKKVNSKYRCPACSAASCSLNCVKVHKTITKCTGVRNRASPIRKVDYDENAFISDFCLLEETAATIRAAARARNTDNNTKNNSTNTPEGNPNDHYDNSPDNITANMPDQNPVEQPSFSAQPEHNSPGGNATNAAGKARMTLLAREAAARNIDLRFLPENFSRHIYNTTYANRCRPETSSDNQASNRPNAPDTGDTCNSPTEQHDSSSGPVPKLPTDTRILYWCLDLYFEDDKVRHNIRADSCAETGTLEYFVCNAMEGVRRRRGNGYNADASGNSIRTDANNATRPQYTTVSCGTHSGPMRIWDASPSDLVYYLRNDHVLATRSNVIHLPDSRKKYFSRDHKSTDTPDPVDNMDMRKYTPLDGKAALRETLNGHCIVEYPVVHVVVKGSGYAKKLEEAYCGLFDKPEPIGKVDDVLGITNMHNLGYAKPNRENSMVDPVSVAKALSCSDASDVAPASHKRARTHGHGQSVRGTDSKEAPTKRARIETDGNSKQNTVEHKRSGEQDSENGDGDDSMDDTAMADAEQGEGESESESESGESGDSDADEDEEEDEGRDAIEIDENEGKDTDADNEVNDVNADMSADVEGSNGDGEGGDIEEDEYDDIEAVNDEGGDVADENCEDVDGNPSGVNCGQLEDGSVFGNNDGSFADDSDSAQVGDESSVVKEHSIQIEEGRGDEESAQVEDGSAKLAHDGGHGKLVGDAGEHINGGCGHRPVGLSVVNCIGGDRQGVRDGNLSNDNGGSEALENIVGFQDVISEGVARGTQSKSGIGSGIKRVVDNGAGANEKGAKAPPSASVSVSG